MNYITLINSFWDLATTNPLSTGQVSLYFALLHVCNRSNWTEWFQAPNQVLSVLAGLSRSGILKARNELKQRGFIDFRERGTKATIYKICTIANSMQDSTQKGVQKGTQDGTQKGVQKSNTLKERNKDETDSCSGDLENGPQQTPEEAFALIYEIYPKKVGRTNAYKHYLAWLKGKKVNGKTIRLTNRQMYLAVRKYVRQCEEENKELKFYKNFDTLMNNQLLDYVEVEV